MIVVTVLLTAAHLFVLSVGAASPAWASCAAGTPRLSDAAFSGTVIQTTRAGRIAQVRTDAGLMVEVRGTDAIDPPGGGAATSVDRSYVTGQRYEFHPINSTSPYSDNNCTATHELPASPSTSAAPAGAVSSAAPAESPILGWVIALGALGALGGVIVLTCVLVVRVRRRRSTNLT
ncbi:hypothetical protein [Pseudonocardia xinjiangensis]|uniref:Tissue inhibitor of metalloproteinase n=1 Tax=Pseudonocardia xinjiangensis TaxID=75289 RepID=A0ABX1RDI2_9PSEU|nr:hypothetical protein [Pseudonocardia xinjiangensis]NMH77494.1 hypothetical protein [Pseudonocardia xinjiangensis]